MKIMKPFAASGYKGLWNGLFTEYQMKSVLTQGGVKMGNIIHAADLFCGAGGTSTGLALAAEKLGLNLKLTAVNHWDIAVKTHRANHPWAQHLQETLDSLKPSDVVPGRRLDLLVASPECTHHSIARAGKPRDDQSRASAWHVLHWCQELYVRNVIIENVPEFVDWGPLGANGKPLKSMRGQAFHAFLNAMQAIGYRLSWKILNCADYGDATTRRRFFLMASRGRRPAFPDNTHGPNTGPDIFGQVLRPWRPASDIIDWSIPGHSIFLRPEDVKKVGLKIRRPLAEKTIQRIAAGIRRYWGEWARPFLVMLYGTGEVRQVERPLATVTANGSHIGLCRPFITIFKGASKVRPIDIGIPTITTNQHLFLCQPLVIPQDARGKVRTLSEGLPTITATGAHALVRPFVVKYYGTGRFSRVEQPLDTITTEERFGLVRPMILKADGQQYLFDILFRMLTPDELAAAHSFPEGYLFAGNKRDIVKQIGNSVPVSTSRALCAKALAA